MRRPCCPPRVSKKIDDHQDLDKSPDVIPGNEGKTEERKEREEEVVIILSLTKKPYITKEGFTFTPRFTCRENIVDHKHSHLHSLP